MAADKDAHMSLGLSDLSRFLVLMEFSSDSNLQELWDFVFLCSKKEFSYSCLLAACCSLLDLVSCMTETSRTPLHGVAREVQDKSV